MKADTISPIMQVCPEKGSIFFSTPKEFNLNLDTRNKKHLSMKDVFYSARSLLIFRFTFLEF